MADAKAEIEHITKVHFYHGFAESLTIKDNPDAPEYGFELIHKAEDQETTILLFKEDAEIIIDALIKHFDIKDLNV